LTYKEAFKALSNQGILGFYKGNLVGLAHFWMNSYLRFSMMNALDFFNYTKQEKESVVLKALFSKKLKEKILLNILFSSCLSYND